MSATATWLDVLEGRARWCVVEGDCLDVLAEMPGGSVDCTATDPPYEAEAHTKQRRVKTGGVCNLALSFEPLTEAVRSGAAEQIARVTKRWAFVFCQVEAAMRWADSLADSGMAVKRIGVWVKPDGMPQYTGDRPGMGYESIVFAHAPGRSRWNGGGRTSVFTFNKNGGDGAHDHETQKPLPLALELVSLFTDPDEVVCDPFAGSGTFGVACLRLGRRAILIEKDAKYAQLARDRMVAEERGQSLREFRAGQIPLFGGAP